MIPFTGTPPGMITQGHCSDLAHRSADYERRVASLEAPQKVRSASNSVPRQC